MTARVPTTGPDGGPSAGSGAGPAAQPGMKPGTVQGTISGMMAAPDALRARDASLILLELEAEIRRQQTEKELVFHLLNESRRMLPFRQAFAVQRRNAQRPWTVIGVSSLAVVDRNAPMVRWIERLAQSLSAGTASVGGTKNSDPTNPADPAAPRLLSRADFGPADDPDASAYPFGHALWLPLQVEGGAVLRGALFFASQPWTEAQARIAGRVGETYAHAWRALAGPARPWHRWRFNRRTRWLIAGAVLLACIFPVSMSALAPMEITAADPAIVAAPLTGVVAEILVAPNEAVKAQQPVLRFEDTRLRNELELAQRRMQVATARFASTAQAAIDSADANREVAINRAELDLATAEYEYARDLMAKSVLHAPVDGIAVYSDRRDWQGRPVETGQQIMKIADPARSEFSIFLPVQDSLLIDENARVKIYLDSAPMRPIEARLLRAGYQAEKTETDTLAFRLTARAEGDTGIGPEALRIGTRGTAQVYGGKVPLLFYVLRRPITVARQTLGW